MRPSGRIRACGRALTLAAAVMASAVPAAAQAPAPPGGAPGASERELREVMSRGARALQAEEYATAADLLERAVRIAPRSVAAHYLLARAQAGMKRLKPASAHYEEVLRLQPSHAGAIMGLAVINEGTGDYPSAERRYRDVLALGPNTRAQRALASLLGRVGRSAEAEALLGALLAADPGDADSRHELALSRALKGDCEAAIPDFRKVLEAQPRRVAALFQCGNCLSRTGRTEEAASMLERFRAVSEEEKRKVEIDKKIHFSLIEIESLAEAGRLEAAIAKARDLVAFAPGAARAHAFLGSLLAESGRNDEALSEMRRAGDLDPTDADALTEAGRLLALAGRSEEALAYFKKAAAADANAAEPHRFLAILYEQMGRRADSEREKAIFLRLTGGP